MSSSDRPVLPAARRKKALAPIPNPALRASQAEAERATAQSTHHFTHALTVEYMAQGFWECSPVPRNSVPSRISLRRAPIQRESLGSGFPSSPSEESASGPTKYRYNSKVVPIALASWYSHAATYAVYAVDVRF